MAEIGQYEDAFAECWFYDDSFSSMLVCVV